MAFIPGGQGRVCHQEFPMSPLPEYFAEEQEYRVQSRTYDTPARPQRRSQQFGNRRGAARPSSFNGIHRRRVKRMAW